MPMSTAFARKQLARFGGLFSSDSIAGLRRGQNLLGALFAGLCRRRVEYKSEVLGEREGVWCIPKNELSSGVILYLHGGGYCCGDRAYARGVGAYLADKWGLRVFAPVYRLAPEATPREALADALAAYLALLDMGYGAEQIIVFGESAGGGLTVSLCRTLVAEGHPAPAAAVLLSPWTDFTFSGASYEANREIDPSMTKERLALFAAQCRMDARDELVSPLFAEFSEKMPPTLICVGGDEIMLHERLLAAGVDSTLHVAAGLWHGYLLYDLRECAADYRMVQTFMNAHLPRPRQLRWMRLDNAAKIYPAARSRRWSNAFRVSATLFDEVDTVVLQHALDVTARRFPSISVRLDKGLFWYYLEELSSAPELMEESAYPLRHMSKKELRRCAFRVLVYGRRIAVEFFHATTDGNGGLVFLKNLLAEYAEQKYGESIPYEDGVLDRRALPAEEELTDCFPKHCTGKAMSRREEDSFHVRGTPEAAPFVHALSMRLSVKEVHTAAAAHGVSITAFLTAALMQACVAIQEEQIKSPKRYRPVKVLIPVNLRRLYPEDAKTLRNFVLYVTPEIDPRMGEYTFDEICRCVKHQMEMEITPKRMSARITTNVKSEQSLFVRAMPLFIKNTVMKLIFLAVGERKSAFTFSNLGAFRLPETLARHVSEANFVLSVPRDTPNNVSAISFGDVLCIDFVRKIREPYLERQFFSVLQSLGLSVTVESNGQNAPRGRKE